MDTFYQKKSFKRGAIFLQKTFTPELNNTVLIRDNKPGRSYYLER